MTLRTLLPAVACVSTAAMAGLYGTFSTLVMPALRRAGDVDGLHAMQLINKAAPAPWLAVGLLVAGGSSAAAAVSAVVRREPAALPVAGAAVYWASIALTIAYHVPATTGWPHWPPAMVTGSRICRSGYPPTTFGRSSV